MNLDYAFIGWCHDEEENHDRIWGAICLQAPTASYEVDGKFVTFWGRRGAKLQTKLVEGNNWTVHHLFLKKLDKGYKEVDKNRLDEVYPEFEDDLSKTAFLAMFKV